MTDEQTATVSSLDLTATQDGGVLKTIKRAGSANNRPSTGNKVFVHYVGTLENGDKFDSSRDRGEQFSFTLGRGEVIKAWDLGVASMCRGELAELRCSAQYAYGESGSPPKIPPGATLIFEVELFDWKGEDISPDGDGTITRSEQTPGEKYTKPTEGANANVDVVGSHSGRVFVDKSVSLIIGESTEARLPEGLDLALKKMTKGERSLIHLAPKWGYKKNAPQEYELPADAPLDFDIKLNDFEKCKESWEMTKEEKVAEAEKFKIRGTEFFQAGKIKLATAKYKKTESLLEFEKNLEGELKEKRDALFLAAQLNLSLCYIKKNEPHAAIKHTDLALDMDPDNVKALFRRAQALESLREYEEAALHLERVKSLDPGNKAALNLLAKCKQQIQIYKEKEKRRFKSMFEKFSAQDHKKEEAESESKRQSAFPNASEGTQDTEMTNGDSEKAGPEEVQAQS